MLGFLLVSSAVNASKIYGSLAVVVLFMGGLYVVWYTVLFGKMWAREMGFDMSVKPTGGQMAKGMIIGVIGNFFLGANKPLRPTRLFTSTESAITWLKENNV